MESTQTLNAWIAAATSGLPVSAAGKFAAEIVDHFAEARRTHIAAGMPDAEADRAALAGLGDAASMGRALRDAHFSRDNYSYGLSIMLMWLGGSLLFAMLSPNSLGYGNAAVINLAFYLRDYIPLVSTLALGAAFLLSVKPVTTLLSEQFDIRLPRAGLAVFIGLETATLAPGLVYDLAVFIFSRFRLAVDAGTQTAILSAILRCNDAAAGVCTAAAALLIATFCIRQLARASGAHPVLRVMLILGVIIACRNIPGLYLSTIGMDASDQWTPAIHALSTVFTAAFYVFLTLLMGIFFHMRRLGAALAA